MTAEHQDAIGRQLQGSGPDVRITALGTPRGLETTLVPARGQHRLRQHRQLQHGQLQPG
ncbi:hypothetical protein PJN18_29195, partial [Mycobacterium kansasii]